MSGKRQVKVRLQENYKTFQSRLGNGYLSVGQGSTKDQMIVKSQEFSELDIGGRETMGY